MTTTNERAERDELAEIRARAEAATPGPWEWEPETDEWGDCGPNLATTVKLPAWPDGSVSPVETIIGSWGHDANGISVEGNDAEFIAHARTDIPKLIAAVEAALEMASNPGDVVGWRGAPDDLANFAYAIQSAITEALA